jgi:hypothetical protein
LADLVAYGGPEGAAALGLAEWPPIAADLEHPSLRGVSRANVIAALVHGTSADVFSSPRSG